MVSDEGSSTETVRISVMTSGYQNTRVVQDVLNTWAHIQRVKSWVSSIENILKVIVNNGLILQHRELPFLQNC